MGINKILVTGSSGMIGTRLCETLIKEGYSVSGVDLLPNKWNDKVNNITIIGDLCDNKTFENLPAEFDVIIHLAAYPRVADSVLNPSIAKSNFDSLFSVVEFARKRGVKKIFFASSREVYGESDISPRKEENVNIETCKSPYTAVKIGSEAIVHAYQKCYGMEFVIFRFSNVYGMYDSSSRVIPLFIKKCKKGEDLVVFGKDKMLDFTFLDDAVKGVMLALSKFEKAKNNVFNLSSEQRFSLVNIAEMLKEIVGSSSGIVIKENKVGEIVKYSANISKAKDVLGYAPKTTIKQGLRKTIEWHSKNL